MEELEQHYRDSYDRFVKIVRSRLGGNHALAEDCVQQAYANAVQYIDTFNPEVKPFEAWFRTILNNTVKKVKVEERHQGLVVEDNLMPEPSRLSLDDMEAISIVDSEIESIDNDLHKQICQLYYKRGYLPRDISMILEGVTTSNVSLIIKRFNRYLREVHGDTIKPDVPA